MDELIKENISENIYYYYHKSSYIDKGANIGDKTKIWHFCHICSGARIGSNCVLGQNIFVGNKGVIGNNVKIQNNVSIYDNVIIEDDVFIGPSVVFTNVINPRAFIERKNQYKTTIIKKGSSIGANATIICGITIGEYSFIGAGSVVTKNVKPYALMVGIPAKQTGWICICGNKLDQNYYCHFCSKKYSLIEDNLITLM